MSAWCLLPLSQHVMPDTGQAAPRLLQELWAVQPNTSQCSCVISSVQDQLQGLRHPRQPMGMWRLTPTRQVLVFPSMGDGQM